MGLGVVLIVRDLPLLGLIRLMAPDYTMELTKIVPLALANLHSITECDGFGYITSQRW